ncbi:MAG: AAA family ATPase [Leptospiraceae bacterium]|nr:AAA family ATPase [Leptospiraceae bacterium]MCP5510447.1 AAA family ATPase [Leptospiraceae bacterium]
MSACTLCLLNFKGGVGKTTLSVNFAAALANTQGKNGQNYKVLLIDADAQANSSVFMLGEYWKRNIFPNPERSLYGIMDRIRQGNIKKIDEEDIIGEFENGTRSPVFSAEKKVLADGTSTYIESETYWPNLHIIPAHYGLINVERDIRYGEDGLVSIKAFSSPVQYFELLDRVSSFIKEYYDFIIIDCPPNLYTMSENILYFCDNIVIPVIPDWLSTNGINWLIMQVKAFSAKYGNRKKEIRGIAPTLWNVRELVFSRHIRILSRSIEIWKKSENYSDLLGRCEIWTGLQRFASVNKSIESLRPVIDYQASEPARVQVEMMTNKIQSWLEE